MFKKCCFDETLDRHRRRLDGQIETDHDLRKSWRLNDFETRGVDHLLHLDGDHVAAGEVLVVEDRAQEPLGQQVLREHFVNRLDRAGSD